MVRGEHHPLVSIIVPMRNEAHNARACLESLAALTYQPLEIIIVDDRSTDGTHKIVEECLAACADTRFRLLQSPQDPPPGWVGKTFAVDFGIHHSTGEYVLIADADIRHAPGSLAESVRLLHGRSMLVRMPLVPLANLGSVFTDFFLVMLVLASRAALWLGALPLSFGAYVLMTREFYTTVGGFAAHRSFPESLPLARLAAAEGRYALALPSPAVSAGLYPNLAAAMRGTLRNINFGLVSPAAGAVMFVAIGLPLWVLSFVPHVPAAGGALLAVWCGLIMAYEYACGRPWFVALGLALVAPLSAALLALLSCAALIRRMLGLPVTWRGRPMRVQ